MSLLEKIKQGKKNYKVIEFPGTEEKVALVILSSSEITEARLKSEEAIKEKGIEDEDYKELAFQQQVVYRALRDKDDREKRVSDNFDEFLQLVDNQEIQYLMVEYSLLTTESSPFIGAVTDEQFDVLKKTLEKMSLKDLNGASRVALRSFLLTLVSKS